MQKHLTGNRGKEVLRDCAVNYSVKIVLISLLVLIFTKTPLFGQDGFDKYGGWEKIRGNATGFFHCENINNRWWLITPEGNVFLSIGVCIARFDGDYSPKLGYSPYHRNVIRKYGNEVNWQRETLRRLKKWGFNTVGSWSTRFKVPEPRLPYVRTLTLGTSGATDWRKRTFPDVFDPKFQKGIEDALQKSQKFIKKLEKDPYLLGYFLDNEIRWGGKVLKDTLSKRHGKKAFVNLLRTRYGGDFSAYSAVWSVRAKGFDDLETMNLEDIIKPRVERKDQAAEDLLEMLRLIANRFFAITTKATRSSDKNHLVLGIRFLSETPKVVVEECGKFSDVVSINYYPVKFDKTKEKHHKKDPRLVYPDNWLADYYKVSGRPLLISETSFKAMDSGLLNKGGASVAVSTQQDRLELFKWFLSGISGSPYIVGYHWFQYMDQPKEGRFDGESNNFGLVSITDTPYKILTDEMQILNKKFYSMRVK